MSPRFTPVGQQAMHQINQAEFKGFSICNTNYKQFAGEPVKSIPDKGQSSHLKPAIATDL